MMRILMIMVAAAVALGGCWPEAAPAQSTCTASCQQETPAAVPDACALREVGALSQADVIEASGLLRQLASAKDNLASFRDADAEVDVDLHYAAKKECVRCFNGRFNGRDGLYAQIEVGTIADVREVILGTFKARIEKMTCKLRAIGVDVPRP
jgi:hypothetical protein